MRTDEILIFNPKYIWFLQFFNRHKDNHQVKSTLMLLILPEIFGDKKPNKHVVDVLSCSNTEAHFCTHS